MTRKSRAVESFSQEKVVKKLGILCLNKRKLIFAPGNRAMAKWMKIQETE